MISDPVNILKGQDEVDLMLIFFTRCSASYTCDDHDVNYTVDHEFAMFPAAPHRVGHVHVDLHGGVVVQRDLAVLTDVQRVHL